MFERSANYALTEYDVYYLKKDYSLSYSVRQVSTEGFKMDN